MTRSKLFWIILPVLVVVGVFVGWAVWDSEDGKNGGKESAGGIEVTPGFVCVKEGEKQQFEASEEGVNWAVETLTTGSVDQNGLFTAKKVGLTKVIAAKGLLDGYATVSVITKDGSCSEEGAEGGSSGGGGGSGGGAIGGGGTTTTTPPVGGGGLGGGSYSGKWSAKVKAKLQYEVNNGFDRIGTVAHELGGEFWFTIVDYATGELELVKEPAGMIHTSVSDEVPTCSVVAINDPDLFITGINGKLVNNYFVFEKDFVTLEAKEGVKMTCEGGSAANYSNPDASVVEMIGQHAFPVKVEMREDGAKEFFKGSFSFAGRQATIDGEMEIMKIDESQTEIPFPKEEEG